MTKIRLKFAEEGGFYGGKKRYGITDRGGG
jgi:hypothetical protein